MDKLETKMVPIPLPTEVPPPPRMDHIPLDILHSATVEMLIQQNEDLSSRLKVNIRRNSQLEQRLLSQEKEISDLNRQRENVLAQIEIIKEKEKIWSGQKKDKERQAESLSKEAELLELRYNELYATSQQKDKTRQAELTEKQSQIQGLEKKLEILHRVRIRAKEKLRSLLIDMAQGIHNNYKTRQQSESSNRLLKKSFADLKKEITEKESFFRDQLENLKKASTQSLMAMDQRLTEMREKNQTLLNQKRDLETEISDLQKSLHDEKKNRIKLSHVTEELSEMRNERIRFKRDMQEALEKSEASREHQQTQLNKLRKEIQVMATGKDQEKSQREQAEKQILKLRKENEEVATQLASLQNLWLEAQNKLEKEELRSQALEKINRHLSQQSKTEKIERATKAARGDSPESIEEIKKESVISGEDPEFHKKVQSVFASQYRTMAKGSDLDL